MKVKALGFIHGNIHSSALLVDVSRMGASASILEKASEEQKAEITAAIETLKGEGVAEEEIEKQLREKYAALLEAAPAAEGEVATTDTTTTGAAADAAASDTGADAATAEGEVVATTGDGFETKKIPLTALQTEIDAAVQNGKTPLVIDNSAEDKVNTFLMYGAATVVDGKKMGLDKTMQVTYFSHHFT